MLGLQIVKNASKKRENGEKPVNTGSSKIMEAYKQEFIEFIDISFSQ